jgi:exonuclease 3'-5' domain-containing protein 1
MCSTIESIYLCNGVTLITNASTFHQFKLVVQGRKVIGIDAEGVDLSRLGSLTLFSLGVKVTNGVHVFLFDMIQTNKELLREQKIVLKEIMEDVNVTKIIHDCRQDSDALFHQFGITLRSVFDTSIYAMKLRYSTKRSNLNKTLSEFRCTLNPHRDEISNLYKRYPNVWMQRPLTPFLIEYASKDVASLFDLQDKMLAEVAQNFPTEAIIIKVSSEQAASAFRDLLFHSVVQVPESKRGCVIGRQGAGVTSIERRNNGAFISGPYDVGFLVLAPTEALLESTKRSILGSFY